MGSPVKFQNSIAFEKHLKEASGHPLSAVFMILGLPEFERKKIIEKIETILKEKKPSLEKVMLDASNTSVETLLQHLRSPSLFSKDSLYVLEGVEKIPSASIDPLGEYLAAPFLGNTLILSGNTLKNQAALYNVGKKEMLVLDLSEEKPWERRDRLQRWLVLEAAKEGKTLKAEAAAHLFTQVGLDYARLQQELIKLLCFTYERKSVEKEDVEKLISSQAPLNNWQLSENLVWQEDVEIASTLIDPSFVLGLIGQIRYHLELGIQIAYYLKEGLTPHEIAGRFPTFKKASFERALPVVKKRKEHFFKEALKALFDLELACKSTGLAAPLLFEHFLVKLSYLKKAHG